MAFSSGTFSLYTPGNPVVTGTTIASSWANNTLSEIATGLSTCVLKDGSQTVTTAAPAKAKAVTSSKPEPVKPAEVSVAALAEEVLIDLLTDAGAKGIERAQLPKAVISSETWTAHPQRSVILKTFRDDSFMQREDAAWVVDGSVLRLR